MLAVGTASCPERGSRGCWQRKCKGLEQMFLLKKKAQVGSAQIKQFGLFLNLYGRSSVCSM